MLAPDLYQPGSTPGAVRDVRFSLTVAAYSPNLLVVVRAAARAWFDSIGQPLLDWDLVVTELCTNAISAAVPGSFVELSLDVDLVPTGNVDSRSAVLCTVVNEGHWDALDETGAVPLDYLVARLPEDQLPNGRGLRIVSALTSGGAVQVKGDVTEVTVWREIET